MAGKIFFADAMIFRVRRQPYRSARQNIRRRKREMPSTCLGFWDPNGTLLQQPHHGTAQRVVPGVGEHSGAQTFTPPCHQSEHETVSSE